MSTYITSRFRSKRAPPYCGIKLNNFSMYNTWKKAIDSGSWLSTRPSIARPNDPVSSIPPSSPAPPLMPPPPGDKRPPPLSASSPSSSKPSSAWQEGGKRPFSIVIVGRLVVVRRFEPRDCSKLDKARPPNYTRKLCSSFWNLCATNMHII